MKKLVLAISLMLAVSTLFAAGSKESTPVAGGLTEQKAKPELRFLINSAFADLEHDAAWKAAEDGAEYEIKYEQITGNEQLMLLIASGEPVDFVSLTPDQYQLMMNEGGLMDITDLLDQYGSEIKASITTLWPASTKGDRIYAIPSTVAQPNSLRHSVVYRKDLLDKAGIKMASTPDEFHTMLKAIKSAYPDMIPLTISNKYGKANPGAYFVQPIASAFDLMGEWQDIDGICVPIVKNPGLKPYIEYMRGLYGEGLIDAEAPALEEKNEIAKFTSSTAVMMKASWNGSDLYTGTLSKLVPDSYVAVMPLLTDANGNATVETWSGVGAFGGIPATSKHPADAIKAINNQMRIEPFTRIALGDEGVDYTKDADGTYHLIQPAFNQHRKNANVFISSFYREDVYPKMWEARLEKNANLQRIFREMKASTKSFGHPSPISLAPNVVGVDNKSALEDYVRNELVSIVAGTKPISALDDLIKYWNANGGQKLEDFYNGWYRMVNK
jgi:putative aldouronate transport system substrate-binding protein